MKVFITESNISSFLHDLLASISPTPKLSYRMYTVPDAYSTAYYLYLEVMPSDPLLSRVVEPETFKIAEKSEYVVKVKNGEEPAYIASAENLARVYRDIKEYVHMASKAEAKLIKKLMEVVNGED